MADNVVDDEGIAREAGYDPKWYLFNGRFDHTYVHLDDDAMVKVWLWGGADRPASPDVPGSGPGTMYRVRMAQGDKLRIQVGGRPTKSGGGSTDGTWEEWLDGDLIRGGWPDGGEGVKQELTVPWGWAYGDTGPDWTRKIPWRCNGAGGSTRVWLTPVGEEQRLIIVEPGAGASPDPDYTNGGGRPMDTYPEGLGEEFGPGAFPYDRETWRPPGPGDPDPSYQEWPPDGTPGTANSFRYSYGWCGNVGGPGPEDDLGVTDPPEAWFAWEQDMRTYSTNPFGRTIEQSSYPVRWPSRSAELEGANYHSEGTGTPPGSTEEPRVPWPEVPVKLTPGDPDPPVNEQLDTRYGETGWEAQGGNGEPSAFGPRCPGGGGWGGGAAGNTTRRQVADGGTNDWISWVRMGQSTGKTGGRWWDTSVVETVIGDRAGGLWGAPDDPEGNDQWRYEILPFWVPAYPTAPIEERPEGLDYCWPESAGGYLYEVDDGEEWGRWVRGDEALDGPFPYLTNPDYDGYVGMGAAWVCAERVGAEPGWALRQIAVGRLAGVSTNLAGIVGAAVGE